MSVTKSFFDITTGRNHGIPASDAVRIVLDSGAALLLDRLPQDGARPQPDTIRAAAVSPAGDDKGGTRLTFDIAHVVTADRVDKALSSLVEKMVLGESGVEVTEWTVPEEAAMTADRATAPFGRCRTFVPFGRHGVALISLTPHGGAVDDEIARLLVGRVETARRDQGNRINAVVVRVPGRESVVGIACLPEKPDPPVGATLTARRMIGGEPQADAPWDQVVGMGRVGLVRRAIDLVRNDCMLAGFGTSNYTPRLSAVYADGRQSGQLEVMSWSPNDETLGKVVKGMVARHLDDGVVSLRVTAVRRDT